MSDWKPREFETVNELAVAFAEVTQTLDNISNFLSGLVETDTPGQIKATLIAELEHRESAINTTTVFRSALNHAIENVGRSSSETTALYGIVRSKVVDRVETLRAERRASRNGRGLVVD